MDWITILFAVVGGFLLIYLLIALVKPEHFI